MSAPPSKPPSRRDPKPNDDDMFAPIGQSKPGHRVMIYGPGGVGKTTLACLAPGPVAFFDLDASLGILTSGDPNLPTGDIRRVADSHCESWGAMRRALRSPGLERVGTVVIDSASRAEQMAVDHVLANVPHEKGQRCARLDDYGFGRGIGYVYEAFVALLGDLQTHAEAGRNVVLVSHDCVATVPNPSGEDWVRYEPRLQSPSSGKGSIRSAVKEWADHVVFIGYDVEVTKVGGGAGKGPGKGRGHGSRTAWPVETPHCLAKSRVAGEPFPVTMHDQSFWSMLGM